MARVRRFPQAFAAPSAPAREKNSRILTTRMSTALETLLAVVGARHPRERVSLSGLPHEHWEQVAALALHHRVGPMLEYRAGGLLPASVRTSLLAATRQHALRLLQQRAAFSELARHLAPQDVPLVALKGLHLTTTIYPANCHRPMGDVDVLVRHRDLAFVDQTARRLGFVSTPSTGLAHHHLPPLVRGPVVLEVHWHISSEERVRAINPEELIDRSVPFPPGHQTRCLSLEDLLLHLCLHAGAHHVLGMGLRALCDVDTLVTLHGTRLDWTGVTLRAREWRCDRSLGLMLTLCQRLLGTDVPPAVLEGLGDAVPPDALTDSAAVFLTTDVQQLVGTSEAGLQLLTTPGLSGKARHVLRHVTQTPGDPSARPAEGAAAVAAWFRRAAGLVSRHLPWLLSAHRRRSDPALTRALTTRMRLAAWLRRTDA